MTNETTNTETATVPMSAIERQLAKLPKAYATREIIETKLVPNTPFQYGAVNIVYGLSSTGKSWQLAALLGKANVECAYIDVDGNNGKDLDDHCAKFDIPRYDLEDPILSEYIKKDLKCTSKSLLDIAATLMTHLATNPATEIVFVLDSLTALGEGQEINNAEKIAPLIYKIGALAKKLNCSIILVDHATPIRDPHTGQALTFKLEGNAEGKKRAVNCLCRYEALNINKPEMGGTFVVEKARGNHGIKIGAKYVISNSVSVTDAKGWFKPGKYKDMTKTEFSRLTKHHTWVREFQDKLFNIELVGKVTHLKVKIDDI